MTWSTAELKAKVHRALGGCADTAGEPALGHIRSHSMYPGEAFDGQISDYFRFLR